MAKKIQTASAASTKPMSKPPKKRPTSSKKPKRDPKSGQFA